MRRVGQRSLCGKNGDVLEALAGLMIAYSAYAATPSAAYLKVVYAQPGHHVVIDRVNVAGRYATVLAHGAMMEGSDADAPILLEHFSFGWQPLESLNFQCRLDTHQISEADKFILMRGMPKPQLEAACGDEGGRDSGPISEIETLRRNERGPLVPFAVVVHDFATVQWYGAGGGEHVYRKRAGRWELIAGGGGAPGSSELIARGVPATYLCPLGVYDAKCPKK
jgi:hypothetical protein